MPVVGSALSGTVSAATAQGYLPQYRGSAAASLAPADNGNTSASNGASSTVANFQSENRPINQDKHQRNSRLIEPMGAEGYLRYVSAKDISQEDRKILEQGWNPNTTATGPVRPGEEW